MNYLKSDLAEKKCLPCNSATAPLSHEEQHELFSQIEEGWNIVAEHHLEKEYKFKDFRHALAFVNLVGEMADRENHHPEISLSWGTVRIQLWTHKINGLTESDFIMAAKSDDQFSNLKIAKACF